MTLNRWRAAIVLLYLVLGFTYSLTTPLYEASDELWHYPFVKYLATNGLSLPVQDSEASKTMPWRQEGSQPPLYYLIAAVVTAPLNDRLILIDVPGIYRTLLSNPHADIGLVLPDGNANMVVHDFEREQFLIEPSLTPIYIARFLSVLFGAGTVWMTFALGRAMFPNRPIVAIGAAFLNATLPMFLFIAGSVNNDNLSNFLGAALLCAVVRLLQSDRLPSWRTYAIVGALAGAGLLAKFQLGFMLPLIALAYVVMALRHRTIRPVIVGGLISGGLTIVIAGWWYVRNFQLYGDPTGLNVFLDIVGRRAIPANAAQLWAERESFMRAFFGFFGGMNVPFPAWVYAIFDSIAILGTLSAVVYVIARIARAKIDRETVRRALPYAVTLVWIGVTFIGYLRWTAETPASQGRLMFGALSAILVWLVVGLTWDISRAAGKVVIGIVGLFFLGSAIAAPFTVIRPAYTPPAQVESEIEARVVFRPPDGSGTIELLETSHSTDAAQESFVFVDLLWRIAEPFNRDWSIFVHLVTEDQVLVAQRDIYPGQGSLALSDLPVGRTWRETIAVRTPANIVAPAQWDIDLGWYNLATNERLTASSVIPLAGAGVVNLGQVQIAPWTLESVPASVPNPMRIRFQEGIELVGYSVSDLSPNAGSSFELTLYWRADAPIARDYVVFAHIIDPPTLTIYAGSDAQPAGWTRPTSSWQPGEIIADTHTLTIAPDTPPAPGIYELEVGLYLNPGDGTFPRLRVIAPDGGMANDYIYLNRVRVLPRETDVP